MVLILVSAHGYLTRSGIMLEYAVHPNASGRTQIYWSAGEGIAEDRQIVRALQADTRNHLRVHIASASPLRWLRIDPMKAPGAFRLENIRVELMGSLLPVGGFGRWVLRAEDAVTTHQLRPLAAREWESTGRDPYFLFRVPHVAAITVFLVNLVSGLMMVACLVLFTRLTGVVEEMPARQFEPAAAPTAAVGVYGAFFVLALMSGPLASMRGVSRTVVYVSLAAWLVYFLLLGRGKVSRVFVRATAALLVVAMVVLPDILFHLGAVDRPLFSRFVTPLYHWQLGKSSSDNFVHSSLRYYDDFRAIEPLIVPGSYFLSDVATGYYASAALPLYAVNVLRHHRYGVAPISAELVAKLCGKIETRDEREFQRYFEHKRKLHTAKRMQPLRYWLVNKDEQNRHVRADCLSRRRERVNERLAPMLKPVYSGNYIDVYEFRYR